MTEYCNLSLRYRLIREKSITVGEIFVHKMADIVSDWLLEFSGAFLLFPSAFWGQRAAISSVARHLLKYLDVFQAIWTETVEQNQNHYCVMDCRL